MTSGNELQAIENTIAIKYNKNYPVVMANKLIRARKDRLTTFEAKLLRLAISNIVELDTDLKTYSVSVAELADFLGIDSSNIYREVPQIAKSLFSKKIYIPTGTYDRHGNENFELYNWVSYVKYENGVITLRLNDNLKPYLLGLDKLFTMYGYDTVLALPEETAIIMYELLISFEGLRTQFLRFGGDHQSACYRQGSRRAHQSGYCQRHQPSYSQPVPPGPRR